MKLAKSLGCMSPSLLVVVFFFEIDVGTLHCDGLQISHPCVHMFLGMKYFWNWYSRLREAKAAAAAVPPTSVPASTEGLIFQVSFEQPKKCWDENIIQFSFDMFLPGPCGDNVETQPLIDIVDVPVPPAPAASTVSSPEISSDDRRSKYQNVKIAMGRGEETLLLGACHVPGETTETKETASKRAAEFTESDDEARTIPGCKTDGCQTRKVGEAIKERCWCKSYLKSRVINCSG